MITDDDIEYTKYLENKQTPEYINRVEEALIYMKNRLENLEKMEEAAIKWRNSKPEANEMVVYMVAREILAGRGPDDD